MEKSARKETGQGHAVNSDWEGPVEWRTYRWKEPVTIRGKSLPRKDPGLAKLSKAEMDLGASEDQGKGNVVGLK